MRDFKVICPNGHAKKLDTVFPRSEAFAFGSCNSRVWVCPECGAKTQVTIQLSKVSVPSIPLQDINAEIATPDYTATGTSAVPVVESKPEKPNATPKSKASQPAKRKGRR